MLRLDRLLTLYFFRPLVKLYGNGEPTLPILMYHSISNSPEYNVAPYYRTVTSPAVFARHMSLLKSQGYKGVSLSEGLAWLRNPAAALSQKLVAITFDDGYRDFYTKAVPILNSHGFKATMYLPTAFISNNRLSFNSRECLTWDEIRELCGAGMEFGSHTRTHPRLVDLSWAKVEQEVRDSKREIEQQLGCAVTAFAYPYAFPQANRGFLSRFTELLQQSGHETCVTTQAGCVRPGDDARWLRRLPVNLKDDDRFLRAKLQGGYDWLGAAQSIFKTLHSLSSPSSQGRTKY